MNRSAAVALVLLFTFAGAPSRAADALAAAATSSPAVGLPLADPGACGDQGPTPCPSPDQKDAATDPEAPAGGVLAAGAQARAFSLKDVKGKALSFDPKALQKPLLLVFWSIFCEPCKEELPLFGYLGEKYAGEGFKVLGVNLDGPTMAGAADRFLKMNKLGLASAVDRKDGKRFATAAAYGVTGTPSLFLVEPGGKVAWSHVGRVQAADLETAVRGSLGL